MPTRVGAAVRQAFAGVARVGGTVRAAVMPAGVRTAVRQAFAGVARVGGTVRAAVMPAGVRTAVREALPRTARLAGHVIVVDRHAIAPSSQVACRPRDQVIVSARELAMVPKPSRAAARLPGGRKTTPDMARDLRRRETPEASITSVA